MLVLWLLGGLVAWLVVAAAVAVTLGRVIRLADSPVARSRPTAVRTSGDLPTAVGTPIASRLRRRAVPLPPFGIALAAVAVALETSGFLLRVTGSTGTSARLLSMDASGALPSLFVTVVFAGAALAAIAGAGTIPGRRSWWLAVGLVAGGITAVTAGSTLYDDVMGPLGDALGAGTSVLSSALAAVVGGILWLSSNGERRDRRRILGILALYAAAAVGLSGLSALAVSAYGAASSWAAAAIFLEESCKALAAVALLIAVLAGVAPRLVLPADWALRRSADAHTLELPEALPARREGTARG